MKYKKCIFSAHIVDKGMIVMSRALSSHVLSQEYAESVQQLFQHVLVLFTHIQHFHAHACCSYEVNI